MKVKNKIKQILSIIVTAMMMMSLFTFSAFATEEGKAKITISGDGAKQAVFTAYKVLDVESIQENKDASNNVTGYDISYKKSSTFSSLGYTVKQISDIDGITDATAKQNALIDLQKAINEVVGANSTATSTFPKVTSTLVGDKAVLDNLDPGYYFIVQSDSNAIGAYVPTQPILISVPYAEGTTLKYERDTTAKLQLPSIDKNILDPNAVKENEAQIGELVKYQITSPVTKYSTALYDLTKVKYSYVDTLDAGLSYDFDTANVTVKADGVTLDSSLYTVTVKNSSDAVVTTGKVPGAKILIDFVYQSKDEEGNITGGIYNKENITVEYSAELNENAQLDGIPNKNTVHLTYSNSPSTISNPDGTTSDTPDSEVETYTYQFSILKKSSLDDILLGGAKFTITGPEGYSETVTTPETGAKKGKIELKGLVSGTYTITETKAPNGYILNSSSITFTITPGTKLETANAKGQYYVPTYGLTAAGGNATKEESVITVTNVPGVDLPQTGGAGTWMFTIGGLVLMAGAVVVFMATRKKKAN